MWMVMRQYFIVVLLVLLTIFPTAAQQEDEGSLVVDEVEVTAGVDAFGQVVLTAEGTLINEGEMAYENVTLFAEVYDGQDELIGEGIGFLVNACGTGLLPSFVFQPDEAQSFSVVLELFDEDTEIERVEILPEGTAVPPSSDELPESYTGIQTISSDEVVQVEWLNEDLLRYGVGCDAHIFTNLDWYQYNLVSEESDAITHPANEQVTDALLRQIGLEDPQLLNRSFLTFPVGSRRIIYQTPINTVITAEPDGSFKRLIYDNLARLSLHGLIWLPQGRFLAYYYGAYGDEVRYFTASLEGQRISASVYDVLPSTTVPGPTPDGAQAVITTTVDGVTGYYLKQTLYQGNELLFEAEPPGNNWPAPIYHVDANQQAFIYIVRPINDEAVLQCFDMQTRALNDITVLPLQLTTDDRAWTWLSPDGDALALAANGVDGGLWLVDLNALGRCGAPLAG
jgi:hypothetical protein